MKRAKMQPRDQVTDSGLQMGPGKNEHDGAKKLKTAVMNKVTSTQGRTGEAKMGLAQLYLQHVSKAEHECTLAKKNGNKTELARLTEHVSNLKKHGIDGFMKFREYGNYSFVTLRSEEDSSESDQDSTISALSGGEDEEG